ncbi:hypothetical protein COCVIDRAFT_11818 [Bipolaris victoriae FI3]|uniref:Uncharacterized protein n=1 Tax=Bipolaris victoriae (strain FI3) TaxID=930091 RepID=W7F230_BIPV3|nr:hypothetical protein COCVIDRAFT_11818 [Bipolaris victoriae FI3]
MPCAEPLGEENNPGLLSCLETWVSSSDYHTNSKRAVHRIRQADEQGTIHDYCAESDMSDAIGPVGMSMNKNAEVLKGNRNRRAAAWARMPSTSLSLTAVELVQVEKDPCKTKGRDAVERAK